VVSRNVISPRLSPALIGWSRYSLPKRFPSNVTCVTEELDIPISYFVVDFGGDKLNFRVLSSTTSCLFNALTVTAIAMMD